MTDELLPCPLCGEKLEPFGHDIDRRVNPPVIVETFKHPYKDEDDPMKDCCLSMLVFDARRWNKRPEETKLRLENAVLRTTLERISELKFLPSSSADLLLEVQAIAKGGLKVSKP